MNERAVEIARPKKCAVFIPTNLPAELPYDISERALNRFKVGISLARELRDKYGRGNVLVVVFGGWPLHRRLPLSVHHAFAAIHVHKLFKPEELDFVASYGVNTVSDLHGTLKWMNKNLLNIDTAFVVTSKGHADRLVAESDMHSLFSKIYHVESGEPRSSSDEDEKWTQRAKDIPAHQYIVSGRASDVTRFGSRTSLEYAEKMGEWAEKNPETYRQYIGSVWDLIETLEEANVVIRSETPGCWRLKVNC